MRDARRCRISCSLGTRWRTVAMKVDYFYQPSTSSQASRGQPRGLDYERACRAHSVVTRSGRSLRWTAGTRAGGWLSKGWFVTRRSHPARYRTCAGCRLSVVRPVEATQGEPPWEIAHSLLRAGHSLITCPTDTGFLLPGCSLRQAGSALAVPAFARSSHPSPPRVSRPSVSALQEHR